MKNVTVVFIMSLLVISMIMNESGVFASENKVTLSTQKPLESPAGKFLYLVYTEAFKRLDIVFVYETLPAKKS